MIEKNVPFPLVPLFPGRGGRMSSYPFMAMEIGDSVFFEGQDNNGRARWMAAKYQSRSGRKFVSKVVEGGIRIWRMA